VRSSSIGAILAALTVALAPAAAQAADDQESTFQDDSLLVYGTPAEQSNALDNMKALGVDRVRVTVYWRLVAPDAGSTNKPARFEGSDPAAYPPGAWDRYDTLVRLAQLKGIGLNFNVTAPGPLWATSGAPRADVADVSRPDAGEFGKFVQAVGARYTGAYTPPAQSGAQPQPSQSSSPPPSNPNPNPLPVPGGTATAARSRADAHAAQAASGPLPRVSYWSIWNEPNQGGWLTPQWQGRLPFSPRLYRSLVDSAWSGLAATGHTADVVLVGEAAPKGANARTETSGMKPLIFLRALYCVDESLRPLQGGAAESAGCPPQNNASDFVAAHPGLFAMTGLSHHPYNFPLPPNLKSRDPDYAALADTPRLTKLINGILSAYGQGRPGGIPIFFTEYGYQTKPPDPFGIAWGLQAKYLDESEYMQWNFPQVKSTSQFLLVDDKPNSDFPPASIKYWGTFQTGLVELDGTRKPSYSSYQVPLWLPKTRVRARRAFLVWAMRRNTNNGDPQQGTVQYAPLGGRRFKALKTATTTDPRGYLTTKVAVPRTGVIRMAWSNSSGGPTYSRGEKVTVGKRRRSARR
jgi:hypothetical protein